MRSVIVALSLVLALAGCEARGSSPENPIYYQCSHP